MKVLMRVNNANLQVNQANVTLVPENHPQSGGVEGNQQLWGDNGLGGSFSLNLTNPKAFGEFIPGTLVEVSIEKVEEQQSKTGATATTPQQPVQKP